MSSGRLAMRSWRDPFAFSSEQKNPRQPLCGSSYFKRTGVFPRPPPSFSPLLITTGISKHQEVPIRALFDSRSWLPTLAEC